MHLNQDLVARLRAMARRGATVRTMVDAIREYLGTDDGLALCADRYFVNAFLLQLGDVRQIEASSCLGGDVYDDGQIDSLLLPLIAATRPLWDA